jgi:hypothetical protein
MSVLKEGSVDGRLLPTVIFVKKHCYCKGNYSKLENWREFSLRKLRSPLTISVEQTSDNRIADSLKKNCS